MATVFNRTLLPRKRPKNELVAQLVEQRPFKAWVLGSIPSELTTHAAVPCPKIPRSRLRKESTPDGALTRRDECVVFARTSQPSCSQETACG